MASPAPNVDLFDAYFRRADLDRDGRISGAEAVSFFQGSGLPKNVLAQVLTLSLFLSPINHFPSLSLLIITNNHFIHIHIHILLLIHSFISNLALV
jgi:hypothetical protein